MAIDSEQVKERSKDRARGVGRLLRETGEVVVADSAVDGAGLVGGEDEEEGGEGEREDAEPEG